MSGVLVKGIGELERHRSIRLVSSAISRGQFAAATIPLSIMVTKALEHAFA